MLENRGWWASRFVAFFPMLLRVAGNETHLCVMPATNPILQSVIVSGYSRGASIHMSINHFRTIINGLWLH